MIQQIKDIADLTVLHWGLAYGGLIVHVLLKLSEIKGKFFLGIKRKDIFTAIASAILIPIILIICTDTEIKTLLPINYLTAFLAGYQTQSFVRSITKIGKTKLSGDEND